MDSADLFGGLWPPPFMTERVLTQMQRTAEALLARMSEFVSGDAGKPFYLCRDGREFVIWMEAGGITQIVSRLAPCYDSGFTFFDTETDREAITEHYVPNTRFEAELISSVEQYMNEDDLRDWQMRDLITPTADDLNQWAALEL